MAAITKVSRFQGVNAVTLPYAATSTPTFNSQSALDLHVCYAQLTGAITINATVTKLQQFQKLVFYFSTDATQRIVTFGTGFVSSGTVTIPASKDAIVIAHYDGTNIRIASREIQA